MNDSTLKKIQSVFLSKPSQETYKVLFSIDVGALYEIVKNGKEINIKQLFQTLHSHHLYLLIELLSEKKVHSLVRHFNSASLLSKVKEKQALWSLFKNPQPPVDLVNIDLQISNDLDPNVGFFTYQLFPNLKKKLISDFSKRNYEMIMPMIYDLSKNRIHWFIVIILIYNIPISQYDIDRIKFESLETKTIYDAKCNSLLSARKEWGLFFENRFTPNLSQEIYSFVV